MANIAAYTEAEKAISLPAGSSLTAGQYHFVTISASGNVNLTAASGGQASGVCYNKPEAGQAATVVISGVAKVVAGGVIPAGGLVISASDGTAITAISGEAVLGRALVASTGANSVIPVLLGDAPIRPTAT